MKWEDATAMIQRLPHQTAFVKSRSRRLVMMRTTKIKPYKASASDVEVLIKQLNRIHGVPIVTSMNQPAQDRTVVNAATLSDWEPIQKENPQPMN